LSGKYPCLLEKRAKNMIVLAEKLLEEELYDLAVLNAEYAAQLYLKAVLYRLTGEEYRGHNIRVLLGFLALVLEEKEFRELAERVRMFSKRERRVLAELEEGHTRAVYAPFEYSREQAERLVSSAKRLVELLESVEAEVFSE